MANQITYEYLFTLIDKITPTINKMSGQIDKMENGFVQGQRKMQQSMQKSNEQLAKMGSGIKNVIGTYIGFQSIKGVTNTLSNFDTVLSGLRANVDNLSEQGFIQLKNRALELGATTEFTATQVGNGMVDLAKAGLNVNDILSSTQDILNTATAAGVGFEQASSMVLASVFSLGRGMGDIGRISDLTAKAANISNASFQEISMAISRGGSAAVEFNTNLEETYAAMATLTDSLMSGERAGSSFRSMLRQLGVESKEGGKALAQYGLTYQDINPKTTKLVDIIAKLQPLLKDTNAAYKLLGDEGKVAGLILSANTEKFIAQTDALEKSAGSNKAMAQMMRDNLGGSVNNLKSALEGLILKFGEAGLTSSLRSVIDSMTSFIRLLADNKAIISTTLELGKMVTQLWLLNKAFLFLGGTATLGAIANFGKLTFWAIRMGGILPTLSFILIGLQKRLFALAMANPFTAITASLYLFYKLIKSLPDLMDKLYEKFTWIRSLADSLASLFGGGSLDVNERIQLPQNQIQSTPKQLQPLQAMLQTQTVNNNTTTNSQIGIDLNVKGIPKGSEVKTKANNVPNGMSVATNYNLGF